MLDPNVQQVMSGFTERWNTYLKIHPALELDGNWPSVGTIDLLTFALRLQQDIPQEADSVVKGAAAYLAFVVDACWSTVANEVSTVHGENGVRIVAQGGEFIPEGEEVVLEIEQIFRLALRDLPDPFPLFTEVERRISFDSNVVSLLGVCQALGVHQSVAGAWQDATPESLGKASEQMRKELARQSAEYYARVFPDEPLGAVAELYLSPLVFPPIFVGESLPAVSSVNQVLDFSEQFGVAPEKLLPLARNLAMLPDETMSVTGIALYAALSTQFPPTEVLAAAQSKSYLGGLLRHAVTEARARISPDRADWVVRGPQDEIDKMHFAIEEEMLLMPWLYITYDRLAAEGEWEKLKPFVLSMSAFEIDEAMRACDALVEQEPSDLDLRLQRIKLDMVAGDAKAADDKFRLLLSEPEADGSARFFHLWSLNALAEGETEKASKYCKAAFSICDSTDTLFPEIANNLGWSLMLQERYEEALQHFDEGLAVARCPVTLLLNKTHLLWRAGQHDAAAAIRNTLFRIAPCDRRVFSSLAVEPPREAS